MTAGKQFRLSRQTLGTLPQDWVKTTYHKQDTHVGFAHIGAGAFHRCHQAEFTQEVLDSGADNRTIAAINLRPPALKETLGRQDCLYTRTLCEGADRQTRLIESISEVHDVTVGRLAAVDLLARSDIGTVTITATEKGYCHVPATGQLDQNHADITHDLSNPHLAMSLPGFLCQVLEVRKNKGTGGLNLVSCDNIASNGTVLQNCVLSFAAARSKDLAGWIAESCRFPGTMVDRIVPATKTSDIEELAERCGVRDEAAVFGEPFRQWALDDCFIGNRPRWDAAGAEFVRDVKNHELIKMRVLNAAQTMLSLLGCHAGLVTSHQAARDSILASFVERTLQYETLPGLPRVPGMEGGNYLAKSLARIRNTAIQHHNHQIATDTSQKIRQRLLDPIRENLATGRAIIGLSFGVAAWFAYLARQGLTFGQKWQVADPVSAEAAHHVANAGRDVDTMVTLLLSMSNVFGQDLPKQEAFVSLLKTQTAALLRSDVHQAVGTAFETSETSRQRAGGSRDR